METAPTTPRSELHENAQSSRETVQNPEVRAEHEAQAQASLESHMSELNQDEQGFFTRSKNKAKEQADLATRKMINAANGATMGVRNFHTDTTIEVNQLRMRRYAKKKESLQKAAGKTTGVPFIDNMRSKRAEAYRLKEMRSLGIVKRSQEHKKKRTALYQGGLESVGISLQEQQRRTEAKRQKKIDKIIQRKIDQVVKERLQQSGDTSANSAVRAMQVAAVRRAIRNDHARMEAIRNEAEQKIQRKENRKGAITKLFGDRAVRYLAGVGQGR